MGDRRAPSRDGNMEDRKLFCRCVAGGSVWIVLRRRFVYRSPCQHHDPQCYYCHSESRGLTYIILFKTYKKTPESDALCYDLHFWLGENTTQDEAGTAAYKTVELDDRASSFLFHTYYLSPSQANFFLTLCGSLQTCTVFQSSIVKFRGLNQPISYPTFTHSRAFVAESPQGSTTSPKYTPSTYSGCTVSTPPGLISAYVKCLQRHRASSKETYSSWTKAPTFSNSTQNRAPGRKSSELQSLSSSSRASARAGVRFRSMASAYLLLRSHQTHPHPLHAVLTDSHLWLIIIIIFDR
jgi:hypothetical protein